MRVLTIFGTRPEAVKLAPVILELEKDTRAESVTCVTAQHRGMLDQVNELFGIKPDFDLDLMHADQSLNELTARVFSHLPRVLDEVEPDWILVQGDTTTVMAAALSAYFHRIKIGHVEAGLRTGNKWQPFPEEINRKVAGVVADLHFAPTDHARANLVAEGVSLKDIHVTGNTIIDALHIAVKRSYDESNGPLAGLPFEKEIVLVTAHRRENFGQPLELICEAIKEISENQTLNVHFVYPVHPNPNVTGPVERILGNLTGVSLLPPLDYHSLIYLMSKSTLVLTDSGGLQEEAPALQIPVFVMRNVTERPEGIEAGVAKLVGTDRENIVDSVIEILTDRSIHQKMSKSTNPYGDGKASGRIVSLLHQAESSIEE
jgi:UDP-N-acetylglucosamine 2-epimerase (non-hydrolysing)